jgi:hypothetical protein
MSTSTTNGRPIPGTTPPKPSDGRWSRVLRALAPGMASVGMFTGAPLSRTVWVGLLTERYGVKRPDRDNGAQP